MPDVVNLNWRECHLRAGFIAKDLLELAQTDVGAHLYGVPRGGVHAVALVHAQLMILISQTCGHCYLAEEPTRGNAYIDDIIDSGRTREKIRKRYVPLPNSTFRFHALVDKTSMQEEDRSRWYSFPWERMSNDDGIQDNITRILQHIGEDPMREGLLETPKRVARSYKELFSGYGLSPADILTTFENEAKVDEMIVVDSIEFYSFCEHHMLPFSGKAHVAYIPGKKIVGVSKLARIVDIYARRLQNQERICHQVTEALMTTLEPLGAACLLQAQHFCMMCRGVGKQHSRMSTSSLMGVFREPAVRQEFLSIIHGR